MPRSNRIKSEFLGMSYGKASHKLRKSIMFSLAQKAGLTICYRCGQEIDKVDDFSIDHKKCWLYEDPGLFWNLDNIAFSHLRCNIRAGRNVLGGRKSCPKGHLWSVENTRWDMGKDGYEYRVCRACDLDRWHERKDQANKVRKIKRLHSRGLSLRAIAGRVGVSHVTVKNIIDGR